MLSIVASQSLIKGILNSHCFLPQKLIKISVMYVSDHGFTGSSCLQQQQHPEWRVRLCYHVYLRNQKRNRLVKKLQEAQKILNMSKWIKLMRFMLQATRIVRSLQLLHSTCELATPSGIQKMIHCTCFMAGALILCVLQLTNFHY